MINKTNIMRYLAIMIIINIFLPILAYNLTIPIFGFVFNMFLWYISIIIFFPKFLISKSIRLCFFFLLTYIILSFLGIYEIDLRWIHQNINPIILSIIIYTYFIWNNDIRGLKIIVWFSIICLIITLIVSTLGNIKYPNATRQLTGTLAAIGDTNTMDLYNKMGIAGYSFFSGFAFITPMFVYLAKIDRRKKILWYFLLVLIFISIFYANITAAVLITLIGFFISILGAKQIKTSIFIIGSILLILIILPRQFYANIFFELAEMTSSAVYSVRMYDIGLAFKQGLLMGSDINTTMEFRANRYIISIESLLNNPIFGSGELHDGTEHIYWMSILGHFGLVGLIPLIMLILDQYKLNIKILSKVEVFYYSLSFFLFILLGFMKAVAGKQMYFFLFLILPGIHFIANRDIVNSKQLRNNE